MPSSAISSALLYILGFLDEPLRYLLYLNLLILLYISLFVIIVFALFALFNRLLRPVSLPPSALSSSSSSSSSSPPISVAFFHPYANSGGGGERVLWQCIHALHSLSPDIHCTVYTGDIGISGAEITSRAQDRFHLPPFIRPIHFQYIYSRSILQASHYPYLTLLFQSLASMIVVIEALSRFRPHIFIDTTGFAFTYPIASLIFGANVAAYVHYPTISTDMLTLVYNRRPTYNNSRAISSSPVKGALKLIYYILFAILYCLVGRWADQIAVNSTWTSNHITRLWRCSYKIRLLYPPVDTSTLSALPLLKLRTSVDDKKTESDGCRENWILSLSQFRPEKDHPLQVQAYAMFVNQYREKFKANPPTKLIMAGGVRDEEDERRVAEIKKLADTLSVQVDIRPNLPSTVVHQLLSQSSVGLHTMWNEHFGIGVVEFQSAGLLTLAHNSGGPASDIVKDGIDGYLAGSKEEYATRLMAVFDRDRKGGEEFESVRRSGRESSKRFSDEMFLQGFKEMMTPLINEVRDRLTPKIEMGGSDKRKKRK